MSYNSGAVQGLYDLVFGYVGGDSNNPNFGAGASIRSAFRIGLTYKGAVFYKMQAGMGDTIFTPLYQVLQKRGVKFEFFHRVRNLGLSADQKSIESIQISRQVTLKKRLVRSVDRLSQPPVLAKRSQLRSDRGG